MFKQAVEKQTNDAVTTNGAKAFKEVSENKLITLFTRAGSYRPANSLADGELLFRDILKSLNSNDIDQVVGSLTVALWARDPRNGLGERELGRRFFAQFEAVHGHLLNKDQIKRFMEMIVNNGRWDDILKTNFKSESFKQSRLELIKERLEAGDGLCFKWMPRPGSRNAENRKLAKEIYEFLGMNQYQFQKYIAANSDTVEQKICAKQFDKIDYSKVPSGAHLKHIRAFFNHDEDRFSRYLAELEKPAEDRADGVKINAGAVTPFNILTGYIKKNGRTQTANGVAMYDAMFDALKDFTEGASVLPMIDTSGSMGVQSTNGTVLDVALSLGVYCAMKNPNKDFNKMWLVFSEKSEISKLNSDSFIRNCMDIRHDHRWGGSTNVIGAFERILEIAKANNLKQSDLPENLIIFTDMQFDSQWGYRNDSSISTPHRAAIKMFNEAGYEAPKLTYWNLCTDVHGAVPIDYSDTGAMMCSGQSPSTLASVFSSEGLNELVFNTLVKYSKDTDYILYGEVTTD